MLARTGFCVHEVVEVTTALVGASALQGSVWASCGTSAEMLIWNKQLDLPASDVSKAPLVFTAELSGK